MRAEIAEQPARWADLLEHGRCAVDAAVRTIAAARPELLVMVARGSSDHAATYAQYLAHTELGIPAALATPASTTSFGTQLKYPRSAALAVSQSGSSPDLLATVRSIQAAGVPVIAYTNQPASELGTLGEVTVDLQAGPEQSVAATKTYTAELLALALTILRTAGTDWDELARDTSELAQATAESLATTTAIQPAVEALARADRILVVGRGYSMATAREAALKFMETSAIAASGWSAADATHGPMGQIVPGTPVIALTSSPAGRESVLEFARAAQELGGTVIEIGKRLIPGATVSIDVPEVRSEFIPAAEIIPLQRIALELALRRGLDPDRPAGLRKVTMTR